MHRSLYQSVAAVAGASPIPGVSPRFFHLINPFTPKAGSEHENAQRITFECIRGARRYFGSGCVEVIGVVFPEDADVVPGDFICSPALSRSIGDLMESPRQLPLLFDILESPLPGGEERSDDYIIYTNIDIAPTPSFYQFVHEVAIRGYDAFAINRRTVDARIGGGVDFGMMSSEIGSIHPGTDCLVFRRSMLGKFVKSDCCLGITAVMKSLLYNVAAFSDSMIIFKDAHATFHLGDDRQWSDPALQSLSDHNKNEARRIASELAALDVNTRRNIEWFATERREQALLRQLGLKVPARDRTPESSEHDSRDKAPGKSKETGAESADGAVKRVRQRGLFLRNMLTKKLQKKKKRTGRTRDELGREFWSDNRLQSEESKLAKEENANFLMSGIGDVRLLDYLVDPVPLVVSAELIRGRSAPIFGFEPETLHPFVIAARVALGVPESDMRSEIAEVLEHYYKTVAPSSFGELAGISLSEKSSGMPSFSYVFPWERSSPDEKICRMGSFVAKENSRRGLLEGMESGWTWVGPVSPGKLEVEVTRLFDLLLSIKDRGYERSDAKDGDIRGLILMRTPQDWVWLATGGQHRACVLSALGNRTCPLRVRGVVRRDDVSAWPNVVRGVYTEEQALTIFDRIFSGDYGHLDEDWRKQVAEKGWI
jgi:hypothetical protein